MALVNSTQHNIISTQTLSKESAETADPKSDAPPQPQKQTAPNTSVAEHVFDPQFDAGARRGLKIETVDIAESTEIAELIKPILEKNDIEQALDILLDTKRPKLQKAFLQTLEKQSAEKTISENMQILLEEYLTISAGTTEEIVPSSQSQSPLTDAQITELSATQTVIDDLYLSHITAGVREARGPEQARTRIITSEHQTRKKKSKAEAPALGKGAFGTVSEG